MRSFHKLISAAALLLFLNACASGGGNAPEDDFGAAGLSLQLQGLEEGEIYLTPDGYRLDFSHFAMAFSELRLGEVESEGLFAADFFDEEVVDLVELEEIPTGEYEDVSLTLGLGGSAQRFLRARGLKHAELPPEELAGLSVFLEASAVNGGDQCTLQVALALDGDVLEVDPDGNHVEIEAGEEAEILVEVDPNDLFSGVNLGGLCQGGAMLTLPSTENADLAEQIAGNLPDSLRLGSTEGHSHSH